MNFNKALLVAAILTLVVGFFKIKINKNDTSDNDKLENIEVLYAKAEFELFNSDSEKRTPRKIRIPIQDGVQFVNISEILYCSKESNRVAILTENERKPIYTTLTLKSLKSKMDNVSFIYSNLKSHILNYEYINKVLGTPQTNQKHYNYHIIMDNRDTIKLPTGKKEEFMNELDDYIENY
jgi:DNA-binding LytR/AlgR family response regulator